MQQGKVTTVKLLDFLRMLAHRWRVVLATAMVCVVSGMALGMSAPKTYTATASLTVSPITTNPFSSAAVNQQINITTERAILSSGEVAAIAAKELGEKVSPGSLQSNAETAAPSGSQILEVSVTLPDPQKAADQANALAKAYLQFRSQGAAEVAAGYIKQLNASIDGLNAKSKLTDSQVQQLQDLIQQRTSLTLASASPGRIIGYASAPDGPSSMGVMVFLTAGAVGGLLLGLTLALLRERTDPKVRTAARLGSLFEKDLVILDDQDHESVRWLVRTVRQTGPKQAENPTIFVGIIALPGSGPVGLATWLAGLTRAHKLDVIAVWGAGVSAKAVDLGWPDRNISSKWEKHDVVYVEIDEKLSGTRLADLVDRLDVVFVSAGSRTLLKRLRVTQSLICGVPPDRVTPIYYAPSRGRRKSHSGGNAPNFATSGWEQPQDFDSGGKDQSASEDTFLQKPLPDAVSSGTAAKSASKIKTAQVTAPSVLVPHRSKKGV